MVDWGLLLLEIADEQIVELMQGHVYDVFVAFLLNHHLLGDYLLRIRLVCGRWDEALDLLLHQGIVWVVYLLETDAQLLGLVDHCR